MNFAKLDPKKREQYLMIVCGIIVVIALFPLGIYLFGSDVAQKKKQLETTRDNIAKLETKWQNTMTYERGIKKNAADALPTDNQLAASEYKNWLATLTSAARFENAQVNNTGTTSVRANLTRGQKNLLGLDSYFTTYKFSVSGRTTLTNLGTFLQRFYEVKTQHLVRSMTIKPVGNAQNGGVEVTMNIEAISIPQTPNKTFVAERKEEDETPYRQWITDVAGRNFFAAYRAPQPIREDPIEVPPAVVSASKHTYLDGVTWSNNQGQAWFNFRLEGRQRILNVGDNFRVGEAFCTIDSINKDRTVDVLVEMRDSARRVESRTIYRLTLGDTFYEAKFIRDLIEEEEAEVEVQQTATTTEMTVGNEA